MRELDVIVVDDDFMVAEIHRRYVDRTPGFRTVAVAGSVREAEELISRHVPDVLLLDVYLPDGSGIDLQRRLRADGRRIAVVMITAAREVETIEGALYGGASDYIVKPFELPLLSEKLTAVAERLLLLDGADAPDQNSIDAVFHGRAETADEKPLPPGLSRETAALVLENVRTRGTVSAAECAEALGLSRSVARRYLEHLLGTGALDIRLQYGKVGRPERRYRIP